MKRTLLCVLAAAALVSACGQAPEPTPQSTTTTEAALWDSCTLSEDALSRAELLPTTKNENDNFEGWHLCSWDSTEKWYYVGVYSSDQNLDSHRNNPNMSDFRPVSVADRQAWIYTEKLGLPATDHCSLLISTDFGAVDFTAVKFSPRDHPEAEMCDLLLAHVEKLAHEIPA